MFGSGSRKWFARRRNSGGKLIGEKRRTGKILKHHRERLSRELDVNKVLPYLVHDRVFSLGECKEILVYDTKKKRAEVFLDRLSSKGPGAFYAFCSVLEEVCPHLLTCLLLDLEDQPAVKSSPRVERVMAPHNLAPFLSETMRLPPIYIHPLLDTRTVRDSCVIYVKEESEF